MDLELTAVFEEVSQGEGGGYAAWVEELPGANTQGETLEEARENLKEAIHMILDANRELTGSALPSKKIIREKITIHAA